MELLILKAIKGDKEAFIKAINSSTPSLYKMSRTMIRNDEDIADIIQDTILTAYEKINTLKEPKYFNTWIIRILINKCNLHLKRNKNLINIDEVYNISSKDTDFKNLELKESINYLRKDYKIVITLYYIMGFSIKEISMTLNEKEGTVKSRLSRARNELRDYYSITKGVK
ncbi:sigma-70 family RNA polymerase sigma factor [Clostridium sp.]|uniref:sigma-70 family RNA polymerase sigma factor n=2 Tax=Clostridium sp. TaxID=1506 RepID=UPI002FC75183